MQTHNDKSDIKDERKCSILTTLAHRISELDGICQFVTNRQYEELIIIELDTKTLLDQYVAKNPRPSFDGEFIKNVKNSLLSRLQVWHWYYYGNHTSDIEDQTIILPTNIKHICNEFLSSYCV